MTKRKTVKKKKSTKLKDIFSFNTPHSARSIRSEEHQRVQRLITQQVKGAVSSLFDDTSGSGSLNYSGSQQSVELYNLMQNALRNI